MLVWPCSDARAPDVEPVNGQIKEGRGLRLLLLRDLEKVDGELHLIAATHNLLKLLRHRRLQQQAQWAARAESLTPSEPTADHQ